MATIESGVNRGSTDWIARDKPNSKRKNFTVSYQYSTNFVFFGALRFQYFIKAYELLTYTHANIRIPLDRIFYTH